MEKGLISVITANYNGKRFLESFFNSVYAQTYKNIEVIMVDNNSRDDSVEYVRKNYPGVKIVENKENSGYAGGNNLGMKESQGEYVAITNNDVTLEPDLLEKLAQAYQEIPNLGAVQPMFKLINSPGNLDSCGSFWTNTGFNYHYGNYKDSTLPIYNKSFPVYSLKGVLMLIPRKIIDEVGLFDDDFWCYFEETDFCHRLWLCGYECWYYPKSFLYHHVAGTSSTKPAPLIQFHSFKNRLCSYLKNLGPLEMTKVLPVYFAMNFIWSLSYLFRLDWPNFMVVYRAAWWNFVNFGRTMEKRKGVQKVLRQKSDRYIFKKIRKNPGMKYYYCLIKGLENYAD